MKQVVDNLREQEYVNASSVEALRKYIRVKNPNSSGEELSAVFADALHKIIDTRIYQFEERHRKKIKDDVLRKAVKKKEFSINAAEVFSSCLTLKLHDDSYIDSFTQWINQNQPIQVTAEKVDKLVTAAEQLEAEYINDNLDEIVDQFEATWAEDTTLSELLLEDASEAGWIEQEIVTENMTPEIEAIEAEAIENEAAACEAEAQEMPQRKRLELLVKPSMKLAMSAAIPVVLITAFAVTSLFGGSKIRALQHQDQGRYANIAEEQVDRYMSLESRVLKKLDGLKGGKQLVLLDGLHEELKYVKVDENKLKKWLNNKNSLLADEPYFSAIIAASKKYGIHPLLMFAIVGQEQAFVPKTGAAAQKIANNPFNVYGSWEKYNTNIYDSSSLAADTIIKSSRNRPIYMNAIRWINRRYAEDPNWWNGVSALFAQMKKDITN